MREIDRKAFFRIGAGAIVGLATGAMLHPVNAFIAEGIQQTTGSKVGNTQLEEQITKFCQDRGLSERECFDEVKQIFTDNEVLATIVVPISEEAVFRVTPSLIVSATSSEEKDLLSTTVSGNGGLLMTRRELGAGIISSSLFAGIHSITSKGFEGIPAPQMVGGLALWYLQRKFGLLANTTAHIVNNFIAIQLMKNTSFP